MNILVTGANGFLGYYLVDQLLAKNYDVIATGKGECRLPFQQARFTYASMDFTDPFSVHDVFEKYNPGAVIHAGAMSKPDECEQNQWQTYVTNVEGTVNLLVNASEHRARFIYVSTDFVFDGERGTYKETDQTNPVNFYGKTKVEAEDAVKEFDQPWAIVRTVLVYGKPRAGRSNLLTIVRDKLSNGESYNVVDDQVRTPTYVEDLASAIVTILERRSIGIFHISGEDVLTPYQMACKTAEYLHLDSSLIRKVTAADFSQPAKRPPRTGFDISRAKTELNFQPHSFAEGLSKTFS